MKLKTLFRPVYLVRRIKYKWYEMRHPDEPWISQAAVRFVEQLLDPTQHLGLEWGSGRSTAWYASKLRQLTSVEHDRAWFEKVSMRLNELKRSNVNYVYVPLDHDLSEPTTPVYDVTPKYVQVAEQFKNGELDFVAVDGHYRQACILSALPKLKSGGLLLVDNTNWGPIEGWGVPADWPIVHKSSNVLTETTVWSKP